MHGHAGHVIPADFDLSRVEAGSHPKIQWTECIPDGQCTFDGPPRTVEGGYKAIAHRLHLAASEPLELTAHGLIMSIEKVAPSVVPELASQFGGAHDVREKDRGEHSFSPGAPSRARHELLQFIEKRSGVTDPVEVVVPWKFNKP